jgi:hypothetical protein
MPKYIVTYPFEIEADTPEEAAKEAKEILEKQYFEPYLEVVEQDKDSVDAYYAYDFHTGRKYRKRNVYKCSECAQESFDCKKCSQCSGSMKFLKEEWHEV